MGTITQISDNNAPRLAPGLWRRQLQSDRRIPQSARRVAEWLSKRPLRTQPGVYSGCQDSCAIDLGLNETTVWRAFKILAEGKYIEQVQRGTRYGNCGRYILLEVDQSTLQFDRFTDQQQ